MRSLSNSTMPIHVLTSHPTAFVTVRELADYWLVSPRQIHKYIESGGLPAVRMGRGSYRIRTKAAVEFERKQMVRRRTADAATPREPAASFALIHGRESTGSAGAAAGAGSRDRDSAAHVLVPVSPQARNRD